MDRQFIILFVIGAYMLAMIIVGLYYSRTNNTVSDYCLLYTSSGPMIRLMRPTSA